MISVTYNVLFNAVLYDITCHDTNTKHYEISEMK